LKEQLHFFWQVLIVLLLQFPVLTMQNCNDKNKMKHFEEIMIRTELADTLFISFFTLQFKSRDIPE